MSAFGFLCESLHTINKPISNIFELFQLARGLGQKYQIFCIACFSYSLTFQTPLSNLISLSYLFKVMCRF